MIACHCCGQLYPDARMDGGAVHFRCWDKHHSDPTGVWPPEHKCEGDGS